MSASELTDAQLDALLGKAANPPPPSDGLAQRITARTATTPQLRRNPFMRAPGRLRRHPTLWTAVIAANALAAAAAASSWDGQRFDFNRLADLPHRVVAAIHLPHHHHGSQVAKPADLQPKREIRSIALRAPASPISHPNVHQMSVPVSAALGMRRPISRAHAHWALAASARHPIGSVPRRDRSGKTSEVHQSAPVRKDDREAMPGRRETKRLAISKPQADRGFPQERAAIQIDERRRAEIRESHDFDPRADNEWTRSRSPMKMNWPPARIGGFRRGPNWGRMPRRHRNQGRRFARRF